MRFKTNFYNVYLCAKKDLTEEWHALPYLVAEEHILLIMSKWLSDWLTLVEPTRVASISKIVAETQAEKTDPKKDSKKDHRKDS